MQGRSEGAGVAEKIVIRGKDKDDAVDVSKWDGDHLRGTTKRIYRSGEKRRPHGGPY